MSSTGRRNETDFTLALKDETRHKWKLPMIENARQFYERKCLSLCAPVFVNVSLQGVPAADFPTVVSGWGCKYAIAAVMLDCIVQSPPSWVALEVPVRPRLLRGHPREASVYGVPSHGHDGVVCGGNKTKHKLIHCGRSSRATRWRSG